MLRRKAFIINPAVPNPLEIRPESLRHLAFVDGLRALAVLSVLFYHAAIDGPNPPSWANIGSRGVDLFFVISGFCLTYPFLRLDMSVHPPTMTIAIFSRFMLRRFSRIAPTYWVALSMFAFLSFSKFGFPESRDIDTSHVGQEYVTSFLFLTSKWPIFNPSFWTLGIEMRWYFLCPLLISIFFKSKMFFGVIAAILYGVYFFTPYGVADAGTLPCFMLGILAADLIHRRHWSCEWAIFPTLILFAIGSAWQIRGGSMDLSDPIWHVASFFFILSASCGLMRKIVSWKPLVQVGTASYSIYLVHGPFLKYFILSGIDRAFAAIISLGIGIVFYLTVERLLSNKYFRKSLEDRFSLPLFRVRKV